MKFKLNIDRNKEERVEATLHGKGDFSYRLEELVLGYSGEDSVMAYTEDDIKELKYRDIECVTVIDSKTYAIDTAGDRYRLKMRLYEISEILPSYFIKINKSSLANRKQIERAFVVCHEDGIQIKNLPVGKVEGLGVFFKLLFYAFIKLFFFLFRGERLLLFLRKKRGSEKESRNQLYEFHKTHSLQN